VTFNLSSRLPGPAITATSFTNYSTFQPGLAPGTLVLIRGAGLAPNVRGTVMADAFVPRLPYELAGVRVQFNAPTGPFAPIYRVVNDGSGESVLIQVPWELTGASASALVNVSGGETRVDGITVNPLMPGILEEWLSDGRRMAIAIRSDGLSVTPTTPARRGEIIRLYATGMGQTTPQAGTNQVGVPDQTLNAVTVVGIFDKIAEVISVKMAENLIGIYEITMKIPNDAPVGARIPIAYQIAPVAGAPSVFSNESALPIQ
jgi:uncharacterized protein (TIGR03437 family)